MTPQTRVKLLEFRFYLFQNAKIKLLPVSGRHLVFPMSDNVASVGHELFKTGDPENIGLPFGILIVSVLQHQLQLLLVYWPPSCVSNVGQCR